MLWIKTKSKKKVTYWNSQRWGDFDQKVNEIDIGDGTTEGLDLGQSVSE